MWSHLSHKISDISNDLSYEELFSTSPTKLAQYLNSIDIENPTGMLGTSYYQATRCAIEIIKAKRKLQKRLHRLFLFQTVSLIIAVILLTLKMKLLFLLKLKN